MDLEDDTHMENTVKVQEVVNVPIMLSDEMLDAIANRLANRIEAMDLAQMIDDRIEYFLSNGFDINDYIRDMDLDRLATNITDEVIETIKERL